MNKIWNIYDYFKGKYEASILRKLLSVTGSIKIVLSNKEMYSMKLTINWPEVSRDKSLLLESMKFIYEDKKIEIFADKEVKKSISMLNIEDYSMLIEFVEKNTNINDISKFCDTIILTSDSRLSGYEYGTPDNIFEIPLSLFDIDKNSEIVNYFNGESSLLVDIARKINIDEQLCNIQYYGQEIDEDVFKIGQLVSFLITGNGDRIKLGDSINEPAFLVGNELQKFDYAISIPPFSLVVNKEQIEKDVLERFKYGIPKRVGLNSDWIIIQHILSSLKNNGKAAILLPLGALYRRGAESIIRKEIVKDDIIDSIIKLPAGIFSYTGIATCWIIIDKNKSPERKNKIQFIDLTKFTVDLDRRTKTVSDEGVKLTCELYKGNEENSISTFVGLDEIEEKEYDLNAFDYIKLEKLYSELDNVKMIELSKVAKIRRGVQIPRSKLDSINTGENRNHYLISLGNIDEKGNIILEDSDKIKAEDRWIDLYEVETGDILITSRGSLFKVALVDENINNAIVSSNLFLIRVDKSKYKPEILKYFLESNIGKELINGITKGSIISSISNKDLEKFLIPNVPFMDQEEANDLIERRDKEYIESINKAKEEYEIAQNEINKLLGLDIKIKDN